MAKTNTLQKILMGAAVLAGAGCSSITKDTSANRPPAITVSAKTEVKDKYLLRIGRIAIDKPVVQTAINISSPRHAPGLTIGTWNNYTPSTQDLSEVDLSANYQFDIGKHLSLNLGAGYYSFRFGEEIQAKDIQQLSAVMTTKDLPLELRLETYQLFSPQGTNGREYILGANKQFNLTDNLSANIGGDIHYNQQFVSPTNSLSIATGNIGLQYNLGNGLGIHAGYKQQIAVDKDNFGNEHQLIFGGSLKF